MRCNKFTNSEIQLCQQWTKERLDVYRFLSMVYGQAPSVNLLETLFSQQAMDQLAYCVEMSALNRQVREGFELIDQFIHELLDKDKKDLATILAVEYTRLMRGIRPGYGPLPPYESVYRGTDKQISKDVLRQIHIFFNELGIVPAVKEQLDFIGMEFALMACWAERELQAWECGRAEEALQNRIYQWDFLRDHMLCWIPRYCGAMFKHANQKFYQGIAMITMGYLTDDHDQLKESIETVQV